MRLILNIQFKLFIFAILILFSSVSFAGDYHQDDSQHVVAYNVTDSNGDFVSGQTVRLTVYKPRDNTFFDFSDSTFKALASVSTLHRTLNENATASIYFTTMTIDSASLISNDIVMTVSNDNATYGDTQSEVVYFDRLEQQVKIHR